MRTAPRGWPRCTSAVSAPLAATLLLVACGDDSPSTFTCMDHGPFADAMEIPQEQVCDGVAHCHRAEDEEGCSKRKNLFCASDDEAGRKVYSPAQKCDGKRDCFFAEDEKDCPDTFLCNRRDGPGIEMVIPQAKVCDGNWDCWTDEFNCDGIETFACDPGPTIPLRNRCDGINHCSRTSIYASDEDPKLCGTTQRPR